MMGIVDAVLPALKGLEIHVGLFQRIAEHAECRDGDVAIADRLDATLAEIGEVLTIGGLPEEGLEALEAHVGDLSDPLGRLAAAGADHGSDTNGFCRIAHGLNVLRLKC